MEPDRALAAFDAEVRRSVRPDGSGARIEADPLVVRWVGADGRGWSGIAWSGLGDADADAVIAAQVAYFAARDEKFEWKLYNYDRPPDLGGRLLAAGFAADGEESLMVTEVSSAPTQADLPPGIRLLPVTDEAGVGLLADVHERVFGTDSSRLRRSVLAQLQDRPEAWPWWWRWPGTSRSARHGSSSTPAQASPACGAEGRCPAGAARASTAP